MAERRRNRKSARREVRADAALQFSRINAVVGVTGLACLALGYWLLAGGDITLAPLLLVLGYIVLIPAALIL